MSPVRILIASFALLLPAFARAQSYECGPSTLGINCRVIVNDGWQNSSGANQSGTTTSSLVVLPGACAQQDRISDVDLNVHLAHPYAGDVEIALAHPDGTSMSVLYRPGITVIPENCPSDDLDLTFDDDDGVISVDKCDPKIPALSGIVAPFNPLSLFDGKPRNGLWTLTIRDHLGGNEGVLLGWTLELPCDGDRPDVTIDTTDAEVSERGSNDKAVVTFTRGGSTAKALEIEYVVTGSASLGDFMPLPGKLTIPGGSATATLEVRAVADEITELDETIIITLLPTEDYEVGGRGSAYITLSERPDGGAAGSPAAGSGAAGAGGRGGSGGRGGGTAGTAGTAGGGEGDAGPDAGDDGVSDDDDGCDCRVAGGGSRKPPVIPLAVASLLLGFAFRRRKRH